MGKVKLVICVVQFPEITELQIRLLRIYIRQPVSFVIVDNSRTHALADAYRRLAEKESCEYFRCNVFGNASSNHAAGINIGLHSMIRTDEYIYYGTVDNDLFPIHPIDLDDLLQTDTVLTHEQQRQHIRYFWPGLCIWRVETYLQNAKWDIIRDNGVSTDSGGGVYYHILAHKKDIRVNAVGAIASLNNPEFFNYCADIFPKIQDCMRAIEVVSKQHSRTFWIDLMFVKEKPYFFHLRDISNWQCANPAFVNAKVSTFLTYMNELIAGLHGSEDDGGSTPS
jgi:hypothetical protein